MAKGKTDNTPEILRVECLWQAASCRSHCKCRSGKGFILSARNEMPAEGEMGRPPRSACSASRLTAHRVGRRLVSIYVLRMLRRKMRCR